MDPFLKLSTQMKNDFSAKSWYEVIALKRAKNNQSIKTSSQMCALCVYPDQVAGHEALVVFEPRPPPVGLAVVLPPHDGDGVALAERQLVLVLSLVDPESVNRPLVHHTQLLLNTCTRDQDKTPVNTTSVLDKSINVWMKSPQTVNKETVIVSAVNHEGSPCCHSIK